MSSRKPHDPAERNVPLMSFEQWGQAVAVAAVGQLGDSLPHGLARAIVLTIGPAAVLGAPSAVRAARRLRHRGRG